MRFLPGGVDFYHAHPTEWMAAAQAALNTVMDRSVDALMLDMSSIKPEDIAQTILDQVQKILEPAQWEALLSAHPMAGSLAN